MTARRPRADLPQAPEEWQVLAAPLPVTVRTMPGREFHVLLLVDTTHDLIVSAEGLDHAPGPTEVALALERGMVEPGDPEGPRRPERVRTEDPELAKHLTTRLRRLGIGCHQGAVTHARRVLRDLAEHMSRASSPRNPRTMAISRALARGYFAAAAAFYRRAPWKRFQEEPIVAARAYGGEWKYLTVTGSQGIEAGVTVFETWPDVEYFLNTEKPKASEASCVAVIFGPASEVRGWGPEGIREAHLDAAGPKAFPDAFRLSRGRQIPLTEEELLWFEALFQSLPDFVEKHLGAESPLHAEEIVEVPTSVGKLQMQYLYPAMDLDRPPRQPPPSGRGPALHGRRRPR